ncbi:NAD(P)H-dependent oxidoreductase [Metabacillus sp. GX 13764]|uniref:NAD(P)H-dependent oxidoreductase n=1 Tax=Metabacillus kandeliae TaxID=2900151 RepID=UPI001E451AC0|nr:NAD(P)H-dependent oxidoreductase [Metabacillus kandeliae]MCD7035185.1 NAD(P)H-dependent oxidoreductase [Metabacillus kandeliae]
MKTVIIYAHPSEKSFCHAVKEACVQQLREMGHEFYIRDLYAMNFQPVLYEDNYSQFYQNKLPEDIAAEQEYLGWAEHLILIYPTWWVSMPAILKGYIDKVLTNGFAFRFVEDSAEGLLNGKKAYIFQTTGQAQKLLTSKQLTSSVETITDLGIMKYCGIETMTHKFFYSVPYVDQEEREVMLNEVKEIVQGI